jgi:[ribosomal protein S5]-alanine N-acetyltransferase
MPGLFLSPPLPADLDEVLAFELDNRAFFEAHINARPDNFYSRAGVAEAIETATREAREDQAYQYLVRDGAGALVGRVNLTRVRRTHYHSAELGYRVAEAQCGKGYASEAVRQVLSIAFGPLKLVRLQATARPENQGSNRTLAKNGFVTFGRSRKSFELAGTWYDLVYYERRAEDAG